MVAGMALLAGLVTTSVGCTSALTSTYLRNMPWDLPEHAAEREPADTEAEDESGEDIALSDPNAPDASADEDRRSAAIDEAISRLSRLGTLDAVAEATLVATLHNTQPEDWPVVIEEFATVLSAAADTPAAEDAALEPDPQATSAMLVLPTTSHVVAKADLTAAPSQTLPPPPVAGPPEPAAAEVAELELPKADAEGLDGESPVADAVVTESPAEADAAFPVAASTGAGLRIRNACFASRVQAWGVVDRFPADRFQAGREVIVYFELDDLTSQPAATGHTTCIDTTLRLVDAAGVTLHEWNFEPLAETCAGRRRDYFARYVLRLPAGLPPGACRLDVLVTDTLADAQAEAALPLDIVVAPEPGAG